MNPNNQPTAPERLLQVATWLKWVRDHREQSLWLRDTFSEDELQAAIVDLERIAARLKDQASQE